MRWAIVTAGLALLSIATCASAQDDEEQPDCNNAVTQTDMTICAGNDFADADEALNAQYRKTVAMLRKHDANLEPDQRGAEAALKKAQRAWVEFRDSNCEAVGFQARGGTMEPMLVADCQANVTRARTKDLAEIEKEFQQ